MPLPLFSKTLLLATTTVLHYIIDIYNAAVLRIYINKINSIVTVADSCLLTMYYPLWSHIIIGGNVITFSSSSLFWSMNRWIERIVFLPPTKQLQYSCSRLLFSRCLFVCLFICFCVTCLPPLFTIDDTFERTISMTSFFVWVFSLSIWHGLPLALTRDMREHCTVRTYRNVSVLQSLQ